jgi:hypothetical protein
VAGLVGGVVLFFWGFLTHAVLPTGTAGMKYLGDSEDAVIAAVRANIKEPGLYPFPFLDTSAPAEQQKTAQERVAEKHRAGPRGLMIVNPEGGEMMTPANLIIEFATNVCTWLLVGLLLSKTSLSRLGCRIGFAALSGLLVAVTASIPHWNWYGFPTAFTLAEGLGHVGGLALVGVAAALIIKPPAASGETAGQAASA